MQVMEVLGPSLMDLMEWVGGSFSLPTVLHIGLQVLLKPSGTRSIDWNLYVKVLVRLQHLHEAGAIHRWRLSLHPQANLCRDIKPENFLIGPQDGENKNKIYMVRALK